MAIKAPMFNGHTAVFKNQCQKNNSTENVVHQNQIPFYKNWYASESSRFFPFPTKSLTSEEHNSSSDMMSGEALWESESENEVNEYFSPYGNNLTVSFSDGTIGCLEEPAYIASSLNVGNRCTSLPSGHQDHLSMELTADEYPRCLVPRSRNMWSPPPSPIFQTSPSPVGDTFSNQFCLSNPMNIRTDIGQANGTEIVEKTFDESIDGSFLYVTTSNVVNLKLILSERGLEARDISKTRTPGVLVVLFKTHEDAKRAFTTQKEFRVRMVPPPYSKRYWFKNPSPKFHVIFETTRRLTVKSGKSSCNVKVGDFLMTDSRMGKGCLILADQMKGRRLRVAAYIGKFRRTDGIIIEQNFFSERKVVGWISTQCYKTKEKFVLRRSMNTIEHYLYKGINAVE